MENNYQAISFTRHVDAKVDGNVTFEHVSDVNNLPVVIHEFIRASNELPIVFIKNADTGQFQSIILTGFDLGENLLVENDKWLAMFTPKSASLYPFKLSLVGQEGKEKKYGFFVDEACKRFNSEEGDRLFDGAGKESKFLESCRLNISDYFQQSIMTKDFINYLTENELLTEGQISLKIPDRDISLEGIFTVNQATLDKLSDDKFLELRKKGYLSLIYSHMHSLHQVDKLARLKIHRAS
jgi:hypothetical protein